MATFHYKASSEDGDIIEGDMQAVDQAQVIHKLREEGYIPIRAEKKSTKTTRQTGLSKKGGLKLEELQEFTHDLATLLNARLPLDRALSVIAKSSEHIKLANFADLLLAQIRKGSSLADACEAHGAWLPHTYAPMMRAGESTGMLGKVLEEIAENIRSSQVIQARIMSAIRYPLFILVVALLTIAMVFTYVVPEFKTLFDGSGAEMPSSSRVIFAISDFVSDFGWLVLVIVLLAGLAGVRFYRTEYGRATLDLWFLRLPMLGAMIRKRETMRLAGTMAMLLEGGTNMVEAINIVIATVGNRAISTELEDLASKVRIGDSFSTALSDTKSLPDRAVQLIKVGEESGRLAPMLREVVRAYDMELSRDLETYLSLIGPALTVGLGIIVAGTIGTILAAILSTYNLPI